MRMLRYTVRLLIDMWPWNNQLGLTHTNLACRTMLWYKKACFCVFKGLARISTLGNRICLEDQFRGMVYRYYIQTEEHTQYNNSIITQTTCYFCWIINHVQSKQLHQTGSCLWLTNMGGAHTTSDHHHLWAIVVGFEGRDTPLHAVPWSVNLCVQCSRWVLPCAAGASSVCQASSSSRLHASSCRIVPCACCLLLIAHWRAGW